MKIVFSIVCCFVIMHSFSQVTTSYMDSNWKEVPKEKAMYYGELMKDGNLFKTKIARISTGKIYMTGVYADSNLSRAIGVHKKYYESGNLLDSTVYDEKGNEKTIDGFSEDGKQAYHAFYDEKEHYMKSIMFDENGKQKPGFIMFQKQAMFPGGLPAWAEYLQTNLRTGIPAKKKAPVGNYTVVVSFLVNKEGKISEVTAENDPGYGTAQEAVRVIKNGPDWIPAVQNNKPVIYRQRQSITFQVVEK